jgi:hypothetical protein
MRLLTAEELKEVLSYDPDTGEFRWKVRTAVRNIGDLAGYFDSNGYRRIQVNHNDYKAHRLAWLYVNGSFPKHFIDHINGKKGDNRISNLREATMRENQCNRKLHRDGRLHGTCYSKQINRWISSIRIGERRKHIGCFSSEEAAHHTYLIWKHNLGL